MSRPFLFIWTALMSATLAWMFWPQVHEGSGEALATLQKREGTVQVRRAGTFNWSNTRQGLSLYALDSIATEAASQAVLQLADGTEILLPPDTQLKIQAAALSQGIEIAVLKGGVAVQKAKGDARKGGGTTATRQSSNLSIATAQYKIDLSALKGTFRLGANAAVEADQPDSVLLKSPQNSLSLNQLNKDGDTVLDGNESDALFEVDELPRTPPPPPPPPPEPKPVKILSAKPLPRLPEPTRAPPPEIVPLALVQADDPDLIFPVWKLESPHLWIKGSLKSRSGVPLVIPATWDMPESEGKWDTIFRISVAGADRNLLIRRKLSEQGLAFTLAEIGGLLTAASRDELRLSVQAGLVRRTEDGKVARFAPDKVELTVHGLEMTRPFTLLLDSLEFKDPNGKWFGASSASTAKIMLHVLNPQRLDELEGFLRGSQKFTIKPYAGSPTESMYGLVRGPRLDMLAEGVDPAALKLLASSLQLDLIFKGPAAAFLGGKGQFDLLAYLERSTDVYYIRRGLSLKLDSQLFKTQAAARDFIKKFNPYFFKQPVDIMFTRTP